MIAAAEKLSTVASLTATCGAFHVSRATLYRRRPAKIRLHSRPARSLSASDRALVLATLNAEQNVDKSTWTVYAELLTQGEHLSRPHVSNDNPFIEAHFKMAKYRPTFPKNFGGVHDARAHFWDFFEWYNNQHVHSGIAYMTSSSVHHGRAQGIKKQRQLALDAAYARHPERFVSGPPTTLMLPGAVWINPLKVAAASAVETGGNQGQIIL